MASLTERFHAQFAVQPAVIAQAPGRVEIIGNHTDYNGGLVVGGAIHLSVRVAVARVDGGTCKIASDRHDEIYEFSPDAEPVAETQPGQTWVNFVLGCYRELLRAKCAPQSGWALRVESDLPAGAGLSSSAALELAVLYALSELAGKRVERLDMVKMAHRAESEFVGVPCGILDQATSAYGRNDALVLIDCASEKISNLSLSSEIRFYLFNTGKAHSLVDSLYSTRHRECRQALGVLQSRYPQLKHLAQASLDQVETVRSELSEAQWKRTMHVVSEQRRVQQVATMLQEQAIDKKAFGQLLNQSHNSSRDWFENSCAELDVLVELLQAEPEVYGSRLTGGGFGGSVLALADHLSDAAQERILQAYTKQFDREAVVLPVRLADGALSRRLSPSLASG